MVALSKELFYKNVSKQLHCNVLHTWETDCLKTCLYSNFLFEVAKGTAKFFIPIYLLKLLINYKKIKNMDFIKSILIAEVTSILYGIILAFLLVSMVCILRKLTGRVYYYNLLFFPGIISGLSLLVESKENQILDSLIFFNSSVEAVLRMIHFSLFKITKARETMLFMGVSGVLMYLLENRKKKLDMTYFWFYTPPRRTNDSDGSNKKCNHENNCWQFSKEGFTKYFSLGYIINVIRKLLPKLRLLAQKPQESVRILFNKTNVKFGLFLGSYVAVYRILTCHFVKWGKMTRKFHGFIAGILSGLTYAICPNVQVLSIGITTILQILYGNVSEKLGIKNNFWLRQVLYMICHGALLHMKFFYPMICPAYYKSMIDACTNNVLTEVFKNILTTHFSEDISKEELKYFFRV